MDRWSKSLAIQGAWRGKQLDYQAVTTLHLDDGSTQEIVHARRLVAKKFRRSRGSTVATLTDVDLAVLDRVFPFEVFTADDWPNLFVDSIGQRVSQGVGQAKKLPLVLIDTDQLTYWTYAGPKVLSGGPGALQTVYRGYQAHQGAIVDPSEYVVGTALAPSGYEVATVRFSKEQADTNGRFFILEADYLLPGSQSPADELARILTAYGITPEAASFPAAAAYDAAAGFQVDPAYGGDGRTGRAIVADLCAAARAWLSQTATGEWAIVQDRPKDSVAEYDTSCDLIELDSYGDGDIPAKVTFFYAPKASLTEDWIPPLSRDVGGASGELQLHNPYVRQHTVADRIVSYWAARLATLREASGRIFATQRSSGDRISISDAVVYGGTRDFIVTGITRPGDVNRVKLREYDADVYVYVPGVLPADATNGYSPDYSFTDPEPPTNAAYVAGGTAIDQDGKVRAYALVHATPPDVNWAKLTAQIVDPTTKEQHTAQLAFNGSTGFYEATIPNLPPNRNLQLLVWATNSNNRDGFAAGPVNFTSATSAALPSLPVISVQQTQSKQLDFSWTNSAPGAAPIKEYVFELKTGAGAFIPAFTGKANAHHALGLLTGTSYTGRVKAIDTLGNESGYATSAPVAPSRMYDDSYIADQGVGDPSIGNGAVSRGKLNLTTWSSSGTVPAGSNISFPLLGYSTLNFFPSVTPSGVLHMGPGTGTIGPGLTLFNASGSAQPWAAGGTSMTP